jgi:hypothetical protein
MHDFKIKLLEFVTELMALFEDKNKLVYKRLIYYHHVVANQIEEEDLYDMAIEFLSKDSVRSLIKSHNKNFVKGTIVERDVDLVWESCSHQNRTAMWKWIETIVEAIEPCLK